MKILQNIQQIIIQKTTGYAWLQMGDNAEKIEQVNDVCSIIRFSQFKWYQYAKKWDIVDIAYNLAEHIC